jgi:hypothetical protein
MTQNEFNALVSQDIQARVAAAQARYEAELADEEYFEAGMTPGRRTGTQSRGQRNDGPLARPRA